MGVAGRLFKSEHIVAYLFWITHPTISTNIIDY